MDGSDQKQAVEVTVSRQELSDRRNDLSRALAVAVDRAAELRGAIAEVNTLLKFLDGKEAQRAAEKEQGDNVLTLPETTSGDLPEKKPEDTEPAQEIETPGSHPDGSERE